MVWHFGRATDTKKLERLQKKALCVVFNDKTSTYKQLHEWAKLPKIKSTRHFNFNVWHNLVSKSMTDIFFISNSKKIYVTKISLSLELALQNTANIVSNIWDPIYEVKWILTCVKNRDKSFKSAICEMNIKGVLGGSSKLLNVPSLTKTSDHQPVEIINILINFVLLIGYN